VRHRIRGLQGRCTGIDWLTFLVPNAGLEEGTSEFMEATLALADLLCAVGAADAATQLLLREDPLQVRARGSSSIRHVALRSCCARLTAMDAASCLSGWLPAVWPTLATAGTACKNHAKELQTASVCVSHVLCALDISPECAVV